MNVEPKAASARWRRRLLKGGGGAVLLVVTLYLLRSVLFGGLLRERIAGALTDSVGGTWSVGAIEGNWVTAIAVRDVRLVRAAPDGVLKEASCDLLEARYSLLGLGAGLGAVHRLDATGLHVVVESHGEGGEPTDLGALLDGVPGRLPTHDLRGEIEVRWADGLVRAAGFGIVGDGAREDVVLEGVRLEVAGRVVEQARFAGALTRSQARDVVWHSSDSFGGAIPRRVALTAPVGGPWQAEAVVGLPGADVALTAGPAGAGAKADGLPVASLRDALAVWGVTIDDVPASGSLAFDAKWSSGALRLISGSWDHPRFRASLAGADLDLSDPWIVRACDEVSVDAPDGAAVAELFGVGIDVPVDGPVAVTVSAARAAQGPVRIVSARASSGTSVVETKGRITLPATPDAWRDATLDLVVHADVDAAAVPPALPEAARPSSVAGRLVAEIAVRGAVREPTVRVALDAAGLRVDDHEVQRLHVVGVATGPSVAVEALEVASDVVTASARGGFDLQTGAFDAAHVSIDIAGLADLAAAFPGLPSLAGSATIRGRLDGDADDERGVAESLRGDLVVTGTNVVVGEVDLGAVHVTTTVAGGVVTIAELSAKGPHGTLNLRGSVERSGAFEVEGVTAELADVTTLRSLVPDLPEMAGAARVEVTARVPAEGGLRAARGHATVELAELRTAGVTATDVHVILRAEEGRYTVRSLSASLPLANVDGAGWFAVDDAGAVAGVLERLDAELTDGPARITRPVPFSWSGGTLDVPDFAAQGTYGRVAGRARIGAEIDLAVQAEQVSLAHLDDALSGRATVDLQLTGTPAAPIGRLAVSVPELVWDGRPGALELELTQSAEGWEVGRVFLDAGDLARVEGSGRLPFRAGVGGIERLPSAVGSLRLDAACTRTGPWLELLLPGGVTVGAVSASARVDGEAVSVDLTVDDVRFVDELAGLPPFAGRTELTLRGDADGTTVHMKRHADGLVDARADLRTSAFGDWTDPLAWLETARSSPITGEVVFDTQQLAALAAGFEDIHHISGRLRGSLTVKGTVGTPQLHGRLDGEDLVLRLAGDVPALDQGRIAARLEERTVWIETLSGRIGYGDVQAQGRATFGDGPWPDVDLTVTGSNVLLARTRDLRLRSDVDLALRGPLDRLAVTGRMEVTDALYSAPVELQGMVRGGDAGGAAFELPAIRTGLLSGARFDVSVRAAETLHVRNNLVRGALSADLRLRGTGAAPHPEGRVSFRNVRVTLPLSSLRIEQGSLTFVPGAEFDPLLHASGGTRMQGYDLQVQAAGTLSTPRILVSSLPALSQEEALLLLTTGTAPTESGDARQAALDRTAGLVGRALLDWVVEPDPEGGGVLDEVSLEVGRERAVGEWSTIELEVPLAPRWLLRGERDRYGFVNVGLVRRYILR